MAYRALTYAEGAVMLAEAADRRAPHAQAEAQAIAQVRFECEHPAALPQTRPRLGLDLPLARAAPCCVIGAHHSRLHVRLRVARPRRPWECIEHQRRNIEATRTEARRARRRRSAAWEEQGCFQGCSRGNDFYRHLRPQQLWCRRCSRLRRGRPEQSRPSPFPCGSPPSAVRI